MRILLALDDSRFADRVAEVAGALARASGADVLLVTVLDPDRVHETYAPAGHTRVLTPQGTTAGQPLWAQEPPNKTAEDRSQAFERARVDAEEYLLGLSKRLLEGVTIAVQVRWSGECAEEIVRAATDAHADLVVVGSHGRTGLAHALMGSVAEAVLRHAAVPVLIVREGARVPGS
jgi:nucleotide-binding universal stress UspA family protein